jgi:hypothetical protein
MTRLELFEITLNQLKTKPLYRVTNSQGETMILVFFNDVLVDEFFWKIPSSKLDFIGKKVYKDKMKEVMKKLNIIK